MSDQRCRKTTIVSLINRFYDIQAGQITYDGIDVKDIRKDDLRRSLAMVIQDTHLFTGTIADNIRYGKLDATDEEIREAAKIANADSFISRLPQGYDTMLYGDGSNLSQGQQQLIAIARAAIAKTSGTDLRRGDKFDRHKDGAFDRKRHGCHYGGKNRICHCTQALNRKKFQCDHGT